MKTRLHLALIVFCATLLPTSPAVAQFVQQGPKLVGTGTGGFYSEQGFSVALSADGNTAIIGGKGDKNNAGAAWIWIRSGGVWGQQGNKLVGSGAVGPALQGSAVAISADGNTAIVGGGNDNNGAGAAWIWTRSGALWTQQGNKLVASGTVGNAFHGSSVALSADGNTAIVGGFFDDSNKGAAWIWILIGGVWTQQGNKLVGSGAVGSAFQGSSVSLSVDGNTAIIGGPRDNLVDGGSSGAAWVWSRSGGIWTQQGSKLVGSSASPYANQGCSVSLSADGNTAIVGGYQDSSHAGAAWIWSRSGGSWIQQGVKLVGSGVVLGDGDQGWSVSLSADGNTAVVGGPTNAREEDGNAVGAVWIWIRRGGFWAQQGSKLVGTGTIGDAEQGQSVSIAADGQTVLVGGRNDNTGTGAAWVFAEPIPQQRRQRAVRH
jgi:hypothetical protein